ncbi:hypothetical protein ACFYYN_43025 [Streptomyces sp. NPDC001902]
MTLTPTREFTRPIIRATSEQITRNSSVAKLQRSLAEFGEARLAEMQDHHRLPADLYQGSPKGLGDGATVEAFKSEMLDGLINRLRPELGLLKLDIHRGTQVIAPPYDHSWNTGLGQPWSDVEGSMVLLGGDQFSGAGFSFFVTAQEDAAVAVIPQGTYEHSFFDLQTDPNVQTKGGAGAIVYKGGSAIVDSKVTSWNRTGISPSTGETVNIAMADVTGISGGPFAGPRLFPVLFDVTQGETYEVWIYLWNACANTDGTPFFCAQTGKVPLVTVEAGPPFVLH